MSSIEEQLRHHAEDDKERFQEIIASLDEIKKTLEPISNTYRSIETFGKWSKIFLGFIVLLATAIITVKEVFKLRI